MDISAQFEKTGFMVVEGAFPSEMVTPIVQFMEANKAAIEQHVSIGYAGYPAVYQLVKLIVPIAVKLKQLGFIQRILGSETLYLKSPPNARWVEPNVMDAVTPIHQDIWDDMPYYVQAWAPLVPLDDKCRGMALYPSLGHAGPFSPAAAETAKPVHIQMKPGDALIFHKYLAHGTLPNTSNRPRLSIDLRFFGSLEKVPKFYLDLQTGDFRTRSS